MNSTRRATLLLFRHDTLALSFPARVTWTLPTAPRSSGGFTRIHCLWFWCGPDIWSIFRRNYRNRCQVYREIRNGGRCHARVRSQRVGGQWGCQCASMRRWAFPSLDDLGRRSRQRLIVSDNYSPADESLPTNGVCLYWTRVLKGPTARWSLHDGRVGGGESAVRARPGLGRRPYIAGGTGAE